MLACMPSQSRAANETGSTPGSRGRQCKALTTGGQRCKRQAVTGLTVCKSHGGGTAASVQAGKQASVSQQAAKLWGISTGAGSVSIKEELEKLARNKITDIVALRLELSSDKKHIGLLLESREDSENEVGEQVYASTKRKHASGVSPWVIELHKAEMELLQILKLLQEVSGGTEAVDSRRLRMQTAREVARTLKAFPGISVDDVVAEVSKRAS
jgi:hypothetical protein